MFDTQLTVIGNALRKPSRRRLQPSGVSLTQFPLRSTSRKFDRATGEWCDGDSLSIRISCWRDLADRVFESVSRGDPLIVHGKFSGREYLDSQGAKRTSYELEAKAVGHNLSMGFATFERAGRGGSAEPLEPDLDRVVLTGMEASPGGGDLGGLALGGTSPASGNLAGLTLRGDASGAPEPEEEGAEALESASREAPVG